MFTYQLSKVINGRSPIDDDDDDDDDGQPMNMGPHMSMGMNMFNGTNPGMHINIPFPGPVGMDFPGLWPGATGIESYGVAVSRPVPCMGVVVILLM